MNLFKSFKSKEAFINDVMHLGVGGVMTGNGEGGVLNMMFYQIVQHNIYSMFNKE